MGSIRPYSKNVFDLRKSSSLLPYIFVKNYMNVYDVNETLYQNCAIHDPLGQSTGSRVGPIWQYSENVNLKNLLYSHTFGQKTECMVMSLPKL